MSAERKIRAMLHSEPFPSDPVDAPDRTFIVRPQEPIAGRSQREWVISDIHDGADRYVTEEIENYRSRTNTPPGDIEILIDPKFFDVYGNDQKRAAFLLWLALIDANSTLNNSS